MSEIERIKKAYEKRETEQKDKLYSYFNKASLFITHQREKAFIEILKKFNFSGLSDKKILDVGCGTGGMLREFIKFGARPENLYGIDLLEDRIELGKYLSPNINFRCGNAEQLPYKNEFFDIAMQFTMFTSILDNIMKREIAEEMLRVLKPKGIILWYDYFMNSPKNPDVKGVSKKEIINLFPDCEFIFRRVTLAPPLARIIVPHSFLLAYLLEKVPFLRTHYLAVIRKKRKLLV